MSVAPSSKSRPVVVAIDLGEGSEALVDAARLLATGYGGQLLLVHVVRDLNDVFDPYMSSVPLDRLQGELALEGKSWLSRLRRDCLDGDSQARELVLSGTPWSTIVETARRNEAQAIVIGGAGHSARLAAESATAGQTDYPDELGSTAARVVRHAPCSVMVVPMSPTEIPSRRSGGRAHG